jgi:hypothetical protein
MKFLRKKDPDLEQDLRRLEMNLMATLRPISPRTEFVHGLRARLAEKEIGPKIFSWKFSNHLLVAGGVVGTIIMIATSIKGLISLIGMIGFVFRFLNRESRRHQATPA